MKHYIFVIFLTLAMAQHTTAQKVDSIYFHLYTDSLKKGTHNYINVDGLLSDGKWLPLTENEIVFTASAGKFSGNELIIPINFEEKMITVKAVLRSDSSISKKITIWIKKLENPDLPTENPAKNKNRRKNISVKYLPPNPSFFYKKRPQLPTHIIG